MTRPRRVIQNKPRQSGAVKDLKIDEADESHAA